MKFKHSLRIILISVIALIISEEIFAIKKQTTNLKTNNIHNPSSNSKLSSSANESKTNQASGSKTLKIPEAAKESATKKEAQSSKPTAKKASGLPTPQNQAKSESLSLPKNESQEEVKSLISYRIEEKRPFSYYRHYLVKNRLIVFPETEGEFPYTLGQCTDANCFNCNPLFPDKCKKCGTGFFLYNYSCEMSCPENFIANTLTGKCVPKSLTENSFLMAYSIGSCVNRCGKKSADCSCSPECKKNGDCCSDYNLHDCDRILDGAKIVEDKCDKSCALCDDKNFKEDKSPVCLQCSAGKFFYKGKCYAECPEDTFKSDINSTCHEIKNCSVENCDSCLSNNILYCKQCMNGYFNHEGKCVKVCPHRYRADRITWVCMEYPVFAWYWVHPSKTSCNKQCGNERDETMDCSCNSDCYRQGNCCQDVDTFCLHFDILRKNN